MVGKSCCDTENEKLELLILTVSMAHAWVVHVLEIHPNLSIVLTLCVYQTAPSSVADKMRNTGDFHNSAPVFCH